MGEINIKKFAESNLGRNVSFDGDEEGLNTSSGVIVGYQNPILIIISINSKRGWAYGDRCKDDRILLKAEEGHTYWYMFPEDLEIID